MAGLTAPSGQMMGVPGNTPLVNRVDLSAARQSQLAAMDELNKFKEQVASMVKKTNSALIWVILGYTKNLIKSILIL
jgi:hypothetical protein